MPATNDDGATRILLVPMEIDSVQKNPSGSYTIHGYVGDYGVTFHASAADYQALTSGTQKLLGA